MVSALPVITFMPSTIAETLVSPGMARTACSGVASTVVTNAVQGKPTSMGQIAQAAVVGAVSGAISGLVGPEAGPVAKVVVGALSSGAGQLVGNAMSGKPLVDGVAQATIVGGVTGGLVEGAGALVKGASGEAGAAEGQSRRLLGSCGLSFRFDTLVATPTGEQTISTLKVGDHVQAYNPVTKTVSIQTVQQVFINYDTDLMDVALAVHPTSSQNKQQQTAVVSHGSHAPPTKTEVVHTTQKHPWLTTQGWITAGQLHLGNEVQLLNGSTATVVGLKVVPGTASMYDLTVSNVHTFAVGDGQFVVHNCPNLEGESNDIKLSPKVNQAAKQLDAGATEVTLPSRSDAEELFLRKYQGEGYTNATGFDGPETKNFFGKANTYHWDTEMDPNNPGRVLGHGLDNPDGAMPHLQIHPARGSTIRIFFPWGTF